jgi:signal transduction histidine kinase
VTVRRALARAVDAYRLLTLIYAAVLVAADHHEYRRPLLGWLLLGGMALWSLAAIFGYARLSRRIPVLLVADVAVAAGMVVATLAVQSSARIDAGAPTLPAAWVAASVMACAVFAGPWGGALAGAAVGAADLIERGAFVAQTFNGVVLLLLAGGVGGYLVRLAIAAETSVADASRAVAAVGERERLAREIHDSTLQVLALIARRGREVGGRAAELADLAAAQETSLRALVTSGPLANTASGMTDLRSGLIALGSPRVNVATPAEAVELPAAVCSELVAAVCEALSNVERHAGVDAQAWVLVESDETAVMVSVRDDGAGIGAGRLEAAGHEGRLGVAQSIVGRIRSAGGTVTIDSHPGQGTEVEIRVPR